MRQLKAYFGKSSSLGRNQIRPSRQWGLSLTKNYPTFALALNIYATIYPLQDIPLPYLSNSKMSPIPNLFPFYCDVFSPIYIQAYCQFILPASRHWHHQLPLSPRSSPHLAVSHHWHRYLPLSSRSSPLLFLHYCFCASQSIHNNQRQLSEDPSYISLDSPILMPQTTPCFLPLPKTAWKQIHPLNPANQSNLQLKCHHQKCKCIPHPPYYVDMLDFAYKCCKC